jgi:hypothetical protein
MDDNRFGRACRNTPFRETVASRRDGVRYRMTETCNPDQPPAAAAQRRQQQQQRPRDLRTSARARQWVEVLAREVAGTRTVPQGPPQFGDMQPHHVEYLWWTSQLYSIGFLTVVSGDSLRRFDSPIDAVNAYVQQSGMPEPFDEQKRILYMAMLTALAPLV